MAEGFPDATVNPPLSITTPPTQPLTPSPPIQIIGNDLSANQTPYAPPNVKFEVDDVEDPWVQPAKFDFIFSRYMAASIHDWPKLVANIYDNLVPGGHAEFQDFDLLYTSADGSRTSNPPPLSNHNNPTQPNPNKPLTPYVQSNALPRPAPMDLNPLPRRLQAQPRPEPGLLSPSLGYRGRLPTRHAQALPRADRLVAARPHAQGGRRVEPAADLEWARGVVDEVVYRGVGVAGGGGEVCFFFLLFYKLTLELFLSYLLGVVGFGVCFHLAVCRGREGGSGAGG